MTREQVVKVMAEALYLAAPVHGFDWDQLPYETRQNYHEDCRTVLAALEASGVRLVPVDMTGPMLVAAQTSDTDCVELTPTEWREAYRATVAASPYAPKEPT